MKRFLKSKRFVGSLVTVVLIGLGVAKPELIGSVITEGYCAEVQCDA